MSDALITKVVDFAERIASIEISMINIAKRVEAIEGMLGQQALDKTQADRKEMYELRKQLADVQVENGKLVDAAKTARKVM